MIGVLMATLAATIGQAPGAAGAASAPGVTPWFDAAASGWLSGVLGALVGVGLGGVGGGVGGPLAGRGVGKPLVVGLYAGAGVFGVVLAGAGVAALLGGQPYHVWYPFLLTGAIAASLSGGLVPVLLSVYRRAERRRVEAALLRGEAAARRPLGGAGGLMTVVCAALAFVLFAGPTALAVRAAVRPTSAPSDEVTPAPAAGAAGGAATDTARGAMAAGGVSVVLAPAGAGDAAEDLRVRVLPVPGLGWAGVIAMYDVGYLHDPAGRAQMAHLAEHMRVTAGVGEGDEAAEAGARWAELQGLGSANAETQGAFTSYDLLAPASDVERLVRAEAERLRSLRVTAADVAREAPRAAAEATQVAGLPEPMVHKFALMACAQAWRHGAADVSMVGALGETPAEEVSAFIERAYGVRTLRLVIAGDVDAAAAEAVARRAFAGAPAAGAWNPEPLPWAGLAGRRMEMTWDLPARAVVVAFAPPEDAFERFAATVGVALAMAVRQGEAMEGLHLALASGTAWPVGELPVVLVAPVRAGAEAATGERSLVARAEAMRREPVPAGMYAALRAGATLPPTGLADAAAMRAQGAQIARLRGMDEGFATGLVALQGALNAAMVERAAGGDAAQAAAFRERLGTMDDAAWRGLFDRVLDPARRFVTVIGPRG